MQNVLTSEQEQYLKRKESTRKFDVVQLEELKWGLEDGLTIEQVEVYANEKFDFSQMREIRLGLENDAVKNYIKLYANPDFSNAQMYQIRIGLEVEHSPRAKAQGILQIITI